MKHSLSEIDEELRTGICSVCGLVRVKLRDATRKTIKARYRCGTIHKNNTNKFSYPYRSYKKDYCEHCNFVAVHISQLDVDHIDGNKNNNDPSNLQTLCSNCHRLKTFLNKDGAYRFGVVEPRNDDKAPTQDFS